MNLQKILGLDAYWQVNKAIAREVGINGALLLAYFINKEKYFREKGELVKTKLGDGFFYLTTEKIEEDVFMKRGEQESAIKSLLEAGFIEKVIAGIPARKHFRLDAEKIFNFLVNSNKENKFVKNLQTEEKTQINLQKNNNTVCKKTASQFAENLQTIYKENIYKNNINKKNNNSLELLLKKARENLKKYGEYENVKLTEEEVERLKKDFGLEIFEKYLKILDEGIEMKGYKYKNHNLAFRKWLEKDNIGKIGEKKVEISDYEKEKEARLKRLEEYKKRQLN